MKNKKQQFSKSLLVQESILIWIITIACIGLAYICIVNQYLSELPWLATMIACPWTAYGVSQACYYRKSEKENTIGGVTYETAMAQMAMPGFEDSEEDYYNEEEEP